MADFSGTVKMGSYHPKPGRRKIIANAPYPIPLKNWDNTYSASFFFWTGLLKCNGVEVKDNIEELYNRGFFGNSKCFPVSNDENVSQTTEKECKEENNLQNISADGNVVSERLVLSHEEAFFLSYAAPCLIIQENKQELTLNMLWNRLCQLNPNFPTVYASYHYFRSKGWIVKSGLKFGVDYIIYKDGPPYYHASFSVLVLNGKNFTPGLSWAQLAALNRTTVNAGKEVLFCYVFLPTVTNSPDCIKNTEIQEVMLTRWVSSEERKSQKSTKNS